MVSRICAFLVWAFVAASLAFWGLRLLSGRTPVPAHAVSVSMEQAARGDILRLFPEAPKPVAAAQPALASRFKVVGAVAPNGSNSNDGVALISVDGRPPVAVRIGRRISRSEDLVVQSVTRTGINIGPEGGEVAATLPMPALPAPAMGTLPPPERLVDPGVAPAPNGPVAR